MIGSLGNLEEALRRLAPESLPCYSKPPLPGDLRYPLWRLREAWIHNGTFGSDEAVLVRQALRWSGGRMRAPRLPESVRGILERAWVLLDDSGILTAQPFLPSWLDLAGIDSSTGIDPAPLQRVPNEAVLAEDYFRESFGYGQWKSRALKEACWLVHRAPPGSITLVALPTGSGKSLCLHWLARFSHGLTLVIVPTVALAIDQYRAACGLPFSSRLNPRYFAADDPDFNPAEVAEAVRSGLTRLLFASPEACVSGRLRGVLDELASQGRFDNMVVDEAHMVGTWGIYFRVDFQLLSTIWRKWRERSGQNLRTLLLSATFTPECRDGLKRLFSVEPWLEFVSQRLRPEIAYHLHQFETDEERSLAVLDCAWRLPRPAIFYTTRVDHAVAWCNRLREEGFKRVECFTGETSRRERRTLLNRWRADEVDVMVATSAFGLGVDKPDVRSVLHACIPENLDRFYQEVGRSGRDGYSSLSILLATKRDYKVAKGLVPKLLRSQTIQQRWKSLWCTQECVDDKHHRYRVNVRTKKEELFGTRTYEENVRWNKRLLLQLLRAGLLNLVDIQHDHIDDDECEWVTLELRFVPHSLDISSLTAPIRKEELETLNHGLDGVEACLATQNRLCSVLLDLYGKDTIRACGGCPGCRALGRMPGQCHNLRIPLSPVSKPRIQVVLGFPSPASAQGSKTLARWLRRAGQVKAARRFACSQTFLPRLVEACCEAFGDDPQHPYRVDSLGLGQPNSEVPFWLGLDEHLVVLHVDKVHAGAWNLRSGNCITHWICDGCIPVDARGKSWLHQPGVWPFTTPETWIDSGGDDHVH